MKSKAWWLFFSFLLTVLAASTLMAQVARQGTYPPPGYVYAWGDDFSGTTLNQSKWMYRTDVKAESSQRPENVRVKSGDLVIEMKKQADRGKEYTGGGAISKQRFRYGYYEARVKMFGGSGWHESVWAMVAPDGTTTYPLQMRTEIDGLEFDSATPERAHMGLIVWHGPHERQPISCTPGTYQLPLGFDATQGFHTYGFEWTAENVKYFLDGKQRCVLDYPPSAGEHDAINFWLTAIGYARGGKIDDSKLPGRMLVDFAAFYRKDGKP
jgi:beta-glucanase (GH16 family)